MLKTYGSSRFKGSKVWEPLLYTRKSYQKCGSSRFKHIRAQKYRSSRFKRPKVWELSLYALKSIRALTLLITFERIKRELQYLLKLKAEAPIRFERLKRELPRYVGASKARAPIRFVFQTRAPTLLITFARIKQGLPYFCALKRELPYVLSV